MVSLEAVNAEPGAVEVELQYPVENLLAAVPPRSLGAGQDGKAATVR